MERTLAHMMKESSESSLLFRARKGENVGYRRFEGKLTEDARNDTPHSVCGYSRQPQHARWLVKRRYAASVWECVRERGEGRNGERKTGRRPRREEEKKREKEAATMSSSSCQPGAHLLTQIILEKEREEMWLSGGGGCRTERQTDEERGSLPILVLPGALQAALNPINKR